MSDVFKYFDIIDKSKIDLGRKLVAKNCVSSFFYIKSISDNSGINMGELTIDDLVDCLVTECCTIKAANQLNQRGK